MFYFSRLVAFLLVVGLLPLQVFPEGIDATLLSFDQKNTLSKETISENKGHLILFDRDRIEQMHAKTLKDIFKKTPVIYYHENRYALPDPLSGGSFDPYRSNFVRVYIDGMEVTQGWMGSGLMLYGDINIDFVDHIEFYYAIPSFETSVEPAYLTIFLYSKDPERDSGGKLNLLVGSRGYQMQSLYYGGREGETSYAVNLSHTDAKREKVDNGTSSPLSRDYTRTQLFAHIKGEDQAFHLQLIQKKADTLAGMSMDATPLESEADYLNIHLDYRVDFSEHLKAQFGYEWLDVESRQSDDMPMIMPDGYSGSVFGSTSKNSTYSAELTYREQIRKHHLVTGVKGRVKKLDSLRINSTSDAPLRFSEESIFSVFGQDQYELSKSELLTFGVEYNKIYRNGGIENDDLLQLRAGYLYSAGKWSYKTYLYRTMFAQDPFGRYADLAAFRSVEPQTTVGITQEIGYKTDNCTARLMVLHMQDSNGLLEVGSNTDTKYFLTIFDYGYRFDLDNSINLQLYYARYDDIFNLDKLEDYSGTLSFANSYGSFDFYNSVVWHRNSIDHINYLDLTSAVSWNASKDLTFTLKGENLLNRAKATNIFRMDPATGVPMAPLKVSPIDKRITVEVEYLF